MFCSSSGELISHSSLKKLSPPTLHFGALHQETFLWKFSNYLLVPSFKLILIRINHKIQTSLTLLKTFYLHYQTFPFNLISPFGFSAVFQTISTSRLFAIYFNIIENTLHYIWQPAGKFNSLFSHCYRIYSFHGTTVSITKVPSNVFFFCSICERITYLMYLSSVWDIYFQF